eukprot:GFUD01014070.1.p1 GENE.GFUD01014070.1~~GFUD01014070.1.p1  ORF type:complete len:372 (+),score=131.29 GFUD01014070.1:128-1117(+)
MEDDSFDIPEDLSAKHRTVSVQTETCIQDKFEQIFEGFSQTQIKSLMNILVQYVLKEDNENNVNEFDKFKQNPSPHTTIEWTPLEPEPSLTSPSTFAPHRQPPPLLRISPTHQCPDQNIIVKEAEEPSPVQRKGTEQDDLNKLVHHTKSSTLAQKNRLNSKLSHIQYTRDRNQEIRAEDEENDSSYQSQQSKEERLLVERKIHLTVAEIIYSPMEQFNDLLASQAVSEEETHICRDIRRRGKNKIAAQNCRKRKISQVSCLESQLSLARSRKENILSERVELLRRHQKCRRRLGKLERDILIRMGKEESSWVINVDRNMVVKVEHKVFM